MSPPLCVHNTSPGLSCPPPPYCLPIQVLQADGGTRVAAINAAVLALASAGVPLRDLAAGCAAGGWPQDAPQ